MKTIEKDLFIAILTNACVCTLILHNDTKTYQNTFKH